jgi:hypothetical protein
VFLSGNFGQARGSYAPYIENDPVLGDLDAQFNRDYLNEETLLSAARIRGFNTAVVGKAGPTAIQEVSQLNPVNGRFVTSETVIIGDETGSLDGVPLISEVSAGLVNAGLPTVTPARAQPAGNNMTAGTTSANYGQQDYFVPATTRVILPIFKKSAIRTEHSTIKAIV